MGMPVKVMLDDAMARESDAEAVFDWLREVDARFSTYKPASEISQINAGRIVPDDYSPLMKEIMQMCEAAKVSSGGYFDIWNGRILDPSGLVKGWAIDRSGQLLQQRGHHNFVVDVGGDVLAMGRRDGRAWIVGVRHPVERDKFAKRLNLSDMAVATSGTYERGQHIYNPLTNRTPVGLRSFTVIGPNIMTADLLATIGFAMGAELGLPYVLNQPGYQAYAITTDLQGLSTPGFAEYNIT